MAEQKEKVEELKNKIKKLEIKLAEVKEEKEEYLEGWQRARANFINYKKKEKERMQDTINYSNEELLLKILPIFDNLKRAENYIPEEEREKDWVQGITHIKSQFKKFLKEEGIEKIETVGKKFDPNIAEAVERVESKEYESDVVTEEIQPGYKLKDKVLRPAKVKVAK